MAKRTRKSKLKQKHKAQRHKQKAQTVHIGETPTPERRKQNGGVTAEILDCDINNRILLLRYKGKAECVLDAYLLREILTIEQYKAALKFRRAYLRAVLRVKVEDSGNSGPYDPEMALLMPIYSETLLNEAYKVLSPAQKAIAISVCGHDLWAGDKDRLKTLKRALDMLVKLWGC